MALGETRVIVSTVLKETMLVTVFALLLGIPASLAAVRLAGIMISDVLYGLKTNDAPSLVIDTAELTAAAAVASLVPAYRAFRIDPLTAIRDE